MKYIICLLLIVSLLFCGCTSIQRPEQQNILTFNCDPSVPADIHLISGQCSDNLSSHMYDFGEEKTVERIKGTITFSSTGSSGEIGFFLKISDFLKNHKIWTKYGVPKTFDINVTDEEISIRTGRYLTIGSSFSWLYVSHSEGIIFFADE